jgi:hypothetical protein
MKAFIAIATADGTLMFRSDYHKALFSGWLKSIKGKEVRIEQAKNPVSEEMRGYYFAAVLPVVRRTCKEWGKLSGDELHEVLKKEFAFFEAWSARNKRIERYDTPVMSDRSSTEKAMQFLQNIAGYLAECGEAMPNPEEYKRFINSAPLKN